MSWYERAGGWAERHRFALDATTTAALALVLVPFTRTVGGDASGRLALLAVLLVAPLAWRRVLPVAGVAAVYTVGLVQLALDRPLLFPADVAVLLALYSVTVYGPRWAHLVAAAGGIVGVAIASAELARDGRPPVYGARTAAGLAVFFAVVVLAVWAFGLLRRTRRERVDALRDRAARLELERDQQARLATAAERTRIARELHDIVAHSLSVMIAQADGGRYAAPSDPAAATRSLETVAETGRAALADMRRLLGVLRTDDGSGGPRAPGILDAGPVRSGAVRSGVVPSDTVPSDTVPSDGGASGAVHAARAASGTPSEASAVARMSGKAQTAGLGAPGGGPRAPQPGLEGLDGLVSQVRASGPLVSLVRVGTPRELPPGAGLTVFRVAQEALTNVLKHAGPGPQVTVLLRWDPRALVLDVQDDGRGAAAVSDASPGFGILGMHERAAIFGGAVTTGPRPGGGFRVQLVLPTTPVSARAVASPVESATP
jgi:signal transduction histidine kinase